MVTSRTELSRKSTNAWQWMRNRATQIYFSHSVDWSLNVTIYDEPLKNGSTPRFLGIGYGTNSPYSLTRRTVHVIQQRQIDALSASSQGRKSPWKSTNVRPLCSTLYALTSKILCTNTATAWIIPITVCILDINIYNRAVWRKHSQKIVMFDAPIDHYMSALLSGAHSDLPT